MSWEVPAGGLSSCRVIGRKDQKDHPDSDSRNTDEPHHPKEDDIAPRDGRVSSLNGTHHEERADPSVGRDTEPEDREQQAADGFERWHGMIVPARGSPWTPNAT